MLRRIVAATMIGALALTSGCAFHNPFAKKAEPVTYEAVVQSELSPEEKVDKLVANMSDADKVGQLLMIGIHGTTLNDDAKFMLNEYRVGGIILFDRNMENKEQVKTLPILIRPVKVRDLRHCSSVSTKRAAPWRVWRTS